MGAVLLGGAYRDQECRPLLQAFPHRIGRHFLDPPGMCRLSHLGRWWVVVVLAAGAAAAEWLRHPSVAWVAVAFLALAAAFAVLAPLTGWRRRGLAIALVALTLEMGLAQWRLSAIELRWPQERERRVEAASRRLEGDLHAEIGRAERLAQAAAATDPDDRESAFQVLDRLVPASGPEMSVVVLDSVGMPWAWAGRHRLPPRSDGDSIGSRATGYYVELEARRHGAGGRTAVAGILIWA